MSNQNTVYIVDSDTGVRKALTWMLECNGLPVEAFDSGTTFLNDAVLTGPSCLLLDMHLPGLDGVEVLKAMRTRPELKLPVIVMTSDGNIDAAVECMKTGADDYLEKPVSPDRLMPRVHELLADDATRREQLAKESSVKKRINQLTQREREILRLLCAGKSSKEMALELSISIKTVSIHRWHLLKKMQAGNATEAVNLAYRANAI